LIEIKRSRKSKQAERWTRGYIESNDPQKNQKHKSIESVQTITTSGVKFVPKMSNLEKARERRIRVRMFRILCSEYFWGRRARVPGAPLVRSRRARPGWNTEDMGSKPGGGNFKVLRESRACPKLQASFQRAGPEPRKSCSYAKKCSGFSTRGQSQLRSN